jgi:DNA-binding CsgD family transcriptional regulator
METTQPNDLETLSSESVAAGWMRHVAAIIESINDLQHLLPALLDATDALTPDSRGGSGILVFTPRESGQDVWCYPNPVERYDRTYKMDPFLSALLRGERGCLTLREVAPPGFEDSAFFRAAYSSIGLSDEIIHGSMLGPTFVVVGRVSRNLLRPAEIEAHRKASAVIRAAALHATRLLLAGDQSLLFEPVRSVEYALAHFGGNVLTSRERDVTHLILRGHNAESITNQLGISQNTVKRHRSRAYKKLGVNSQGELFSRFLESLGSRPTR